MRARHHETKNPLAPNLVDDELGDSWEVVAEDCDNACIVQHSAENLAGLFQCDPAADREELFVVQDGATFVDDAKNSWVVSNGRWIKIPPPDSQAG